jgi:hypothetical protein
MNPLWLLLIVPASAFVGLIAAALCAIGKIADLDMDNMRLRKQVNERTGGATHD